MASLDTFLARLTPRAMGVADPIARQALIDTAVEFCQETLVVQQVLPAFDTVAEQRNYPLTLDTGLAVASLRKAWYCGRPLAIPADDNVSTPLAYMAATGDAEAPLNDPTDALWHDEELYVFPVPEQAVTDALVVRVALKPTHDATAVPDVLLADWREAIVDGALYRVLGMRGTIHYDPAESDRAQARYRHQINRASAQARTGKQAGDLTVRMRPFA